MNTGNGPDRSVLRGWLPGYLALAAIWGSSFLFIKVGIRELHPLYVALGRVAAGMLTLLVILAFLRQRLPTGVRVWAHLTFVGAIGVALPFTLFGYGEQRISSMLAGIWNATTPLIALPVAVLVFRTERMTARRAVGLGLGFVGVLVILGVWRGVGGPELIGQLMCFGAALCYGIAIPYQRRFLAGRPESGVALAAGQLVAATALLAVVAPLVAGAPPAPSSIVHRGRRERAGARRARHRHRVRAQLPGDPAGRGDDVRLRHVPHSDLRHPHRRAVLGEQLTWYQPVGAAVVLLGVAVSQGVCAAAPTRRPAPEPDARAASLVTAGSRS